MAIKLHDGQVYAVKDKVKIGESARGKYCLVKIKPEKGRAFASLWLKNDDHGFNNDDEGCSVRVDSFGVSTDDPEEGVAVSYKEAPPKGSGKWYLEVACQGVIAHKVGDACDSGGGFEQGTFTEISDGDLPF